MEITALKTAISYESKLVRRNWLFYLFILGMLGYMVGVLIPWDTKYNFQWSNVALASSILSSGIYFLNLLQSLIVVFLVCDIQRKRKKAETRDVLFTRPIGNGQSFLGEFLSIFLPFLAVDVIFMLACVVINIVVPDSPVNLWVPLFYLLVRVLPVLVFVTGLSLLVNRLIKLPFISWFILVGFLYFSYTFLVTPLHGMLDFRGCLLSDSFSKLVGFMHVEDNLLQRGAFLLLGISFLCFSVLLERRLPNAPGRKFCFIIPASLCLVFSLSLGYIYVDKFQTRLNNRIAYREAFLEYNEYPTARVIEHEITYRPAGNKFSATSLMKVQNRRKAKMDKFPLFLNPGLEVIKIESNGQAVPFCRDRQVVIIEHSLAPGDMVELEMEYGGGIDEDIYQVNITDEDYFAPAVYTSYHENYGKRTAFVSSGYTLLVPEVIWYPMTVAPVELASKELNFTSYTLRVENSGEEMTVLSQGESRREGDGVMFENVQNLTGLSLCMGEFRKRAVTVDSLTVEFYAYPGNDFYMKHFDEWKALREGAPGRERKLKKIFDKCKNLIEANQINPYPFKYFKLIETPPSFLRKLGTGDNVQPEIVFFEERFATTDHYKPDVSSAEYNVQETMLYENLPYNLRQMNIDRIFTGYTFGMTSDCYKGINFIYNQSPDKEVLFRNIRPRVINYIAERGLKGCIIGGYNEEHNVAISLKAFDLLGYLTTITTWDSLNRFMQEFNTRARFREIDFDLFIDEFEQRFGQNIRAYMDEWYTSRKIPWLSIKDLSLKTIEELQVLDFKVGNFSETDGIVSVLVRGCTESGKEGIKDRRSYLIKAGECKRIVVHEYGGNLILTTNFSGNMPKTYLLDDGKVQLSGTIPDEGVTLLTREQFYPPGEIIVDNEDENFHLIDSTGNRKRLVDLISKENEEEYTFSYNLKANTWALPFLAGYGGDMPYGESILSAFVKKAGTGKFKAEWVASLPETGRYEIFIYRTFRGATSAKGEYTTNYPGMKNYYTVYTPKGKEEIVLEFEEDDPAWVSLGVFVLPAGESRVVLDDRGTPVSVQDSYGHSSECVPLITADAVKWVKVK